MLTIDADPSGSTVSSWDDGGITPFWWFDPGLEEEVSTEPLEDFGAILTIRAGCFESWAVGLRLEVCFTISLRLLAIALSFSPLSIQSGLGPKP